MDEKLLQKEINKCAEVIIKGGVILFPTDTIWGIGCDALDETAVDKIYLIKKRNPERSLIVLMKSTIQLQKYLPRVPESAIVLFAKSTRPTTLVLDNVPGLASNIYAGDGSVGIRITKDPFCKGLIEALARPLISTSANFSGEKFEGNFASVRPEIVKSVDYVTSWRQTEMDSNSPSRVIRVWENGKTKLIRD